MSKGAPKGNKYAKKGEHSRTIISLAGPANDVVVDALLANGNAEPTPDDVRKKVEKIVLDWGIFGFANLTPEEEAEREEERAELATLRADYQWIVSCQQMDIQLLEQIIADGPLPPDEDGNAQPIGRLEEKDRSHYLKRHRQAIIVLEARKL